MTIPKQFGLGFLLIFIAMIAGFFAGFDRGNHLGLAKWHGTERQSEYFPLAFLKLEKIPSDISIESLVGEMKDVFNAKESFDSSPQIAQFGVDSIYVVALPNEMTRIQRFLLSRELAILQQMRSDANQSDEDWLKMRTFQLEHEIGVLDGERQGFPNIVW